MISGFLITSLLVREAEKEGRVSLVGFYARRARRILPAATLVLLATIVGSVVLLSAVEASAAIEDAVWATFFAANIKLTIDGTDYFNAEAAPSPLQHYWSLAVEEQFYLVWPLLVLLLCVLVVRAHRPIRDVAVPVLGLIVVASFAWSVVQTGSDTVTAYFSPFTRAWELALGALAACLAPRLAKLRPDLLAVASWLGLGMVLVAALAYDESTLFPGYAAALPGRRLGAAARRRARCRVVGPAGRPVAGAGPDDRRLVLLAVPVALADADPGRRRLGRRRRAGTASPSSRPPPRSPGSPTSSSSSRSAQARLHHRAATSAACSSTRRWWC